MGLVITLIFVGILLILVEMFLIPGIGFAGFLGLGALVGSGVYSFMHFGTYTGVIVTIVDICLVVGMLVYALRAKTWNKLALNTVIDTKARNDEVGISVGEKGVTMTRLALGGTARFGNSVKEVKSVDNIIDPGKQIEVVDIEDNKILVKEVASEAVPGPESSEKN
ncbi:MAG: NfeD family protein [Bacteroidales bacterium]